MNTRHTLHARWASLSPREQRALRLAALILGAALLWWLALAPALHTLRTAPVQQQALDAQWQRMQQLQAQAQALQSQPQLNQDAAVRALRATLGPLGAGAQLQVNANQAILSLKQVPASALAPWLAQLRSQANLQVSEAHLSRNTVSPAAWDGTLVITLPPR